MESSPGQARTASAAPGYNEKMDGRLSPERATHGRPFSAQTDEYPLWRGVSWGGGRFAPLPQAIVCDLFGVQNQSSLFAGILDNPYHASKANRKNRLGHAADLLN